MKTGAGILLALAMAAPVAAHGTPEDMKPRVTGLPAGALAAGQTSDAALDEGRALLSANNPAQALSAFRIALAQAPQSVAALNGIAVAYDRLGRSDLARQHFEMALALEPAAADIAYNLGLALVRAGQDRAAIPHLQRAAQGNDARAAAAARRTLAQVGARLTMVSAPAVAAPAATAGPRIDMASSGEAVLVLAPAAAPAPRMAIALPTARPASPANPPPAATVTAAAPATLEPAMADRLGEAAALTIPMAPPAPVVAAAPAPATPEPRPQMAPRTLASRAPDQPAPPAPTLPPPLAIRPALAPAPPARQPATAALLVQWRRTTATVQPVAEVARKPALPAPQDHDDKAAIRLAIARLELLIAEVHRG